MATSVALVTVGLLWLFAPAKASAAQGCPSGWFGPHRDTCYHMSDAGSEVSWEVANAACQKLDQTARLASVTHNNSAFLSKRSEVIETDAFWVGLRSQDDKWNARAPQKHITPYLFYGHDEGDVASPAPPPSPPVSAREERVDYTNWEKMRHREPSGSRATNDDCVRMVGKEAPREFLPAGQWMDWNCAEELPFVCQWITAERRCPGGWTSQDGVCYKLYWEKKSFANAEVRCKSNTEGRKHKRTMATLAMVRDHDKLACALPYLRYIEFFWVGLRSTPGDDGLLRWLDVNKTPMTSTSTKWLQLWYSDPDGPRFGADNDCVLVNGRLGNELYTMGEWADYDCEKYKARYMCAMPVKQNADGP